MSIGFANINKCRYHRRRSKRSIRAYPQIRLSQGGLDLSWPRRPTGIEGSERGASFWDRLDVAVPKWVVVRRPGPFPNPQVYQSARFIGGFWQSGGCWLGVQTAKDGILGQPLSSTFAIFRNSLCYRKLQTIPHLFMHFPNSQIHKELGHGPDAGDPKLAKVELSGRGG